MERYIVHPEADQDSAPYWQSLREHKAKLQKCGKCGKFRFPPGPSCYYCGTLGGSWEPISGKGVIYTWSVIHHPVDKRLSGEVPFTVAMVDLEEGPRIVGRLVNADKAKLKAGMPVKARYEDLDQELTLMYFEPA